MNVLLTGGRMPSALEMARLLAAAGHRVVAAESVRWHLTRFSSAVARSYVVPSPRFAEADFVAQLAEIARSERIDVIVPACEEIFRIAGRREAVPCDVLAAPLATLARLHSKWAFVERARTLGLRVPATRLARSDSELSAAVAAAGDVVVKPVWSRFASRAVVQPRRPEDLARVRPTAADPWVVQELVRGRALSVHVVAHAGRLTAFCAYPCEITLGTGPAMAFRAVSSPPARAWVERFVAAESFTGQAGFDFVEEASGAVVALECNPRATSGVHLFAGDARYASALLDASSPCIEPAPGARAMLAAGMLAAGARRLTRPGELLAWWHAFRASRDVVLRRGDLMPALGRHVQLAGIALTALRHGLSLRAASTHDIEWNGEGGEA